MGRGLSDLERGILGIACTINAHQQEGVARPRAPVELAAEENFRWEWLAHARGFGASLPRIPCDYRTPLGVCLLYRIAPAPFVARLDPRRPGRETILFSPGFFASSPATGAAKVATARAARRLVRRGLLVPAIAGCKGGDYLLTGAGIEAGRPHARPVPLIEQTLRYFAAPPTRRALADFDVAAYCRALAAELGTPPIG
jgi:hypothetical protein